MLRLIEENDVVLAEADGFGFVLENNKIVFASRQAKDLKKFKDFKDTHHFFLGNGIKVGTTAISAYQQNKRLTTKLFAKTAMEKTFYQRLVDDLVATKKYKVKKRYQDGGIVFEIVRI